MGNVLYLESPASMAMAACKSSKGLSLVQMRQTRFRKCGWLPNPMGTDLYREETRISTACRLNVSRPLRMLKAASPRLEPSPR